MLFGLLRLALWPGRPKESLGTGLAVWLEHRSVLQRPTRDPESGVKVGLMCGLPQGWGASIHRPQVCVGAVLNKWRRGRQGEECDEGGSEGTSWNGMGGP